MIMTYDDELRKKVLFLLCIMRALTKNEDEAKIRIAPPSKHASEERRNGSRDGPTNQRADGQTNGQTDGAPINQYQVGGICI